MSSWRPPAEIRVKVIGLPFQDGHLLAAEVRNRAGELSGVRPLGGSVELGERRETALRREFREELGTEIDILGPWRAYENIFTFEGETGHEIVFATPIALRDRVLPTDEAIFFTESDDTPCRARWFRVADLIDGRPKLYPDGLREGLSASIPRDEA